MSENEEFLIETHQTTSVLSICWPSVCVISKDVGRWRQSSENDYRPTGVGSEGYAGDLTTPTIYVGNIDMYISQETSNT